MRLSVWTTGRGSHEVDVETVAMTVGGAVACGCRLDVSVSADIGGTIALRGGDGRCIMTILGGRAALLAVVDAALRAGPDSGTDS